MIDFYMMMVDLLFLIAMWCEQTQYDAFALHECRAQLLTCVISKRHRYEPERCFLETPLPEAEAI